MRSPFLLGLLLQACAGHKGSDESGAVDDSGADDSGRTDTGPFTTPVVVAVSPVPGAVDVAVNTSVEVLFSEDMDCSTLTSSTFTVSSGDPAATVQGTVICAGETATFWPSQHFPSDATYTANVLDGAESAHGVALASPYAWSFSTGSTTLPGLPVNLGTAGNFVMLAKAAISTVPTSAITGDIGVSPAAASYLTGFSLSADSTNVFSTSSQVTGRLFAADYAPPTPSNLTLAVGDMELAFTDAAGRAPDLTEVGAGNIGGMTLAPGVYKWGTDLLIPADVTLSGSATDAWIFEIAGGLTLSSGARVGLAGGALPKNVFWQVSGAVELGTTSHLEGVVLTKTAITLRTGATVNGRLLAQTAIDIDGSTVVQPAD